jgi:Ca2+-transporting ATPase
MSQVTETPSATAGEDVAWHLLEPDAVLERLGTDRAMGLSGVEAGQRLARVGPNALRQEAKPSVLKVALGQVMEPMTLMLVAVAVVSVVIGQGSTAVVVAALILLNVVMGTNQELKARASVDALASLQVPQARVIRDRVVSLLPAADLVPGDIVAVEAGDIVPADGRLL